MWAGVADQLRERGSSSLAVDLFEQGHSLDIGTRFRLADQADAVVRLLSRTTSDR